MRRFSWIVVAALAVGSCADDNALYRDPKLVRGYKPSDSSSVAAAYDRDHDRGRGDDWRDR